MSRAWFGFVVVVVIDCDPSKAGLFEVLRGSGGGGGGDPSEVGHSLKRWLSLSLSSRPALPFGCTTVHQRLNCTPRHSALQCNAMSSAML